MNSKFLQYLKEAPIPDGEDFSTTKKLKDDYLSIFSTDVQNQQIEKSKYKRLGYGSSRMAVECDVPLHYFNEEDQTELDLTFGEQIKTVLKFAINDKGIKQNRSEFEIWQKIKHSNVKKYFCPILDWSGNPIYGNNKQFTLSLEDKNLYFNVDNPHEKIGVLWVQMPYVIPAESNPEYFREVFTKEFGFLTEDNNHNFYKMIRNFGDMFVTGSIIRTDLEIYRDDCLLHHKTMNQTQIDNLNNLHGFIRANASKLIIGDFAGLQNWGIYKNKPIILDYGYGVEEHLIYYSGHNVDFKVYINNNGTPIIYFKMLNI